MSDDAYPIHFHRNGTQIHQVVPPWDRKYTTQWDQVTCRTCLEARPIDSEESEVQRLKDELTQARTQLAAIEALAGERGEWIGYGGLSGWVAESFNGQEPEALFQLSTPDNAPILASQYNEFTAALRAALTVPAPTDTTTDAVWRDCGQHPCITCDKPGRRDPAPTDTTTEEA